MNKQISKVAYGVASALLSLPLVVSAQDMCPDGFTPNEAGVCVPRPSGSGLNKIGSLSELIATIIQYALYFSGIIAVLFIIYGGYQYITAGGNTEQAEKGRKALTNAIIGLVLVGVSFLIVRVVSNAVVRGPTN